jgi:hypothetical protein
MTPGPHGTQPLVAGYRRRASNTYGVKHRSTAREASPRRHCLNTPRPSCRTTSTVRFSPFTPQSVPSSSPSPSTRPRVPVATYASTPTQQSPRGMVWQPRTRRWSRQTDNVAGSSDVKSRKEATHASGTIA